jgi:phosphatidate cytidylyltransferase
MTDDRNNNDESGGGFDEWLDDEPGPVTDPYKMLASEADDDPGVADEDSEDVTTEVEVVASEDDSSLDAEDETTEIEATVVETVVSEDEEDETAEIEVSSNEAQQQDAPEAASDDEDDTGELEVTSSAGQDANAVSSHSSPGDESDAPTSGIGVGFGALWDPEADQDPLPLSEESSPEFFDMTQEDYLHTATKEHVGLAESIALADEEDTAQVAIAAPIPGLDATVVGFDDVVEAEGHGRVRAKRSSDLVARVITAIVLLAALGAALLWQPALVALALGVFLLGAGEFYTALLRSGRKPISLFGFVGIAGAGLGAYFSGALWIPLAFVLIVAALLLFYAVVPGKIDPLENLALTITVMVWAGLGTYAMLIAKSDAYRTLVLGVVVTVAAMDIAQYFFGRALGRHKLSPWVSPKKTVEGLLAGVVVALTIGALLHFFPPFELTSGLAVGAAVAVFAPVGDLAMSAAKRSLGLKDMGSVLPGHGGFLDRIDGLIFVIPVAWAIFVWAGIL